MAELVIGSGCARGAKRKMRVNEPFYATFMDAEVSGFTAVGNLFILNITGNIFRF